MAELSQSKIRLRQLMYAVLLFRQGLHRPMVYLLFTGFAMTRVLDTTLLVSCRHRLL